MIHDDWQSFLSTTLRRDPDDGQAPRLAYLPCLGVVRFTGVDARRFLQGYLTCDVDGVRCGALTPTALCNLKGRVVASGWVTATTDGAIRLILHRSLTDTLGRFLERYLAFSKAHQEDESDAVLVLGGTRLPDDVEALALSGERYGERALVICDELDRAKALWLRVSHDDEDQWLAALTQAGVPLLTQPVSERFLPQMLNLGQLGAVDFHKGCYLGQEVVARAQHRGAVKRTLRVLDWTGPGSPAAGSELRDLQGEAVGVVVFAVAARHGGGPATAVVHNDAVPPFRVASPDGDIRLV
jgi:tRNA-modifying protein YgfZ